MSIRKGTRNRKTVAEFSIVKNRLEAFHSLQTKRRLWHNCFVLSQPLISLNNSLAQVYWHCHYSSGASINNAIILVKEIYALIPILVFRSTMPSLHHKDSLLLLT